MPVRVQVPPSVPIHKNRIERFGFFITKPEVSLLTEWLRNKKSDPPYGGFGFNVDFVEVGTQRS